MLSRLLLRFSFVRELQQRLSEAEIQLKNFQTLAKELDESLAQCRLDVSGARQSLVRAEADIEYWKAKSDSWETEYKHANADGIHSREVTADFISQLRFGVKIYDKAPALPERRPEDFKPILKQKQQARDVVRQAERQFDKDLAAYYKRANQPPDIGVPYQDVKEPAA